MTDRHAPAPVCAGSRLRSRERARERAFRRLAEMYQEDYYRLYDECCQEEGLVLDRRRSRRRK